MEKKPSDEISALFKGFQKELYEETAKKSGVTVTALKLFLEDNRI